MLRFLPLPRTLSFLESSESKRTRMLALAAVLVCIPLSLLIDVPVARFCAADRVPGELQRLLTWSEVVAHGLGVAVLAMTVYVLDPVRRKLIPRLLASAFGAGLFAYILKLSLARFRPHHFQLDSVGVFDSFDSFAGWLPVLFPIEGHRWMEAAVMSFPSGHSAVAVGFGLGLGRIYPRGRALFVALAVLAAAQRIETGAHFVSDTLAGAACGLVVASLVTNPKYLGAWFDRLEKNRARHLGAKAPTW
jgi:membrane-associated phospholipid phosphatase